jgi:hypothetical protein
MATEHDAHAYQQKLCELMETSLCNSSTNDKQNHTDLGMWHTTCQDTTYLTKHIPLTIPSYLAASAGTVPLKRAAVHATPAGMKTAGKQEGPSHSASCEACDWRQLAALESLHTILRPQATCLLQLPVVMYAARMGASTQCDSGPGSVGASTRAQLLLASRSAACA